MAWDSQPRRVQPERVLRARRSGRTGLSGVCNGRRWSWPAIRARRPPPMVAPCDFCLDGIHRAKAVGSSGHGGLLIRPGAPMTVRNPAKTAVWAAREHLGRHGGAPVVPISESDEARSPAGRRPRNNWETQVLACLLDVPASPRPAPGCAAARGGLQRPWRPEPLVWEWRAQEGTGGYAAWRGNHRPPPLRTRSSELSAYPPANGSPRKPHPLKPAR